MKKKFFGGIAVLAIAAVAALNINVSKERENLSGLALTNVEVLAYGEGPTPCGGPKSETTTNCLSTNSINCKDFSGCQ
ncbi:hypothetical protein AGMMS50262_05850 [Bacteroidia bacterium]|nr:hypothetical protein AGMMS50262_05850 [Bacteroidia bacterium]